MVKLTGKIKPLTAMIRVISFAGWQNISVQWDASTATWEYWSN